MAHDLHGAAPMICALLTASLLTAAQVDALAAPDHAAQNMRAAGIASVSGGTAVLLLGAVAVGLVGDAIYVIASITWIALGVISDTVGIGLMIAASRRERATAEDHDYVPRPLESFTLAKIPLTTIATF